MAQVGGIAGERLRAFIERIERLEDEKKDLQEQIKEVFSEAKENGFDTRIMRQLLRLRRLVTPIDPSRRNCSRSTDGDRDAVSGAGTGRLERGPASLVHAAAGLDLTAHAPPWLQSRGRERPSRARRPDRSACPGCPRACGSSGSGGMPCR